MTHLPMMLFRLLTFALCLVAKVAFAQEIDPAISVGDRAVGDDPMKRYFLIRHRVEPSAAPKEFGLVLILPGGPGSAEMMPFCANVLTKYGVPKDMVVAELVAPVWDKQEAMGLVWPGRVIRSEKAKFTTEEFIDAVIGDVSAQVHIREGRVFTLGWSSSGHVLYSSAFENPKISGSFIAMSRFFPVVTASAEKARGKRFYFWHSPDDAMCPFAEAETAAAFLSGKGASTIVRSYKGGHGWVPMTFYADRIKEALEWFSAGEEDAKVLKAKIEGK